MAKADDFHVWFHPCTVRITLANGVCGTGFFAAPGYVVTCEHVVREAGQGPITLGWQGQEGFAQAELLRVLPDHDLALLGFRPPDQVLLPWVWLDADLQVGDRLYTFGYPEQYYDQGRPATVEMEGFLEDSFL
ncbi:MAG: serine protease, partial [Nodosilinea sp.]